MMKMATKFITKKAINMFKKIVSAFIFAFILFVYSAPINVDAQDTTHRAMTGDNLHIVYRAGTAAERAAETPRAGDAWVETDTGKLYICYSAGTWVQHSDITSALTATAAELNIMDGVTATYAEINYVDALDIVNSDNYASIAAAITAAGTNGIVYIPTGTHTLSAALTPLDGQKIYGAGRATLLTAARSAQEEFEYASDAAIRAVWSSATEIDIYSQADAGGGGDDNLVEEGSYSAKVDFDGTAANKIFYRDISSTDWSDYSHATVYLHADNDYSAHSIQFFIKDDDGGLAYWDLSSHAKLQNSDAPENWWIKDIYDLSSPDSGSFDDEIVVRYGLRFVTNTAMLYYVDTIRLENCIDFFSISSKSRVTISNLAFQYGASAVYASSSDAIRCENLFCLNQASFPIEFSGTTDSVIEKCQLYDCDAGVYLGSSSNRNRVALNHSYDCNRNAFIVGSSSHNTLVGNVIKDSRENGICFSGADFNVASANNIVTCIKGISFDDSSLCLANGNHIYDVDWHGILSFSTGDVNFGNSITGNTIKYAGFYGINLAANSRWTSVVGNTILDSSHVGTVTYDGIRVYNESDNNLIIGNISRKQAESYQKYGVHVDDSTCDNTLIALNQLTPNQTDEINDSGTGTIIKDNYTGDQGANVASASTVTLPLEGDFFVITGTTNITSVTASLSGRQVTLKFNGILTFTDGSNLKIAGNLVTTADDTIAIVCDGTNWYEVSRSVN